MAPIITATHFALFLRYEKVLYHVMSKSLAKNKDKIKKRGKAKIHNANGIHNYLTQVVFYMAAKFYERYGMNPDLDEHSLGYHCSGYLDLWNSVVKRGGLSKEVDRMAEKKLTNMVSVSPGADFKSVSGIRLLRNSDDKVHLMMIIMISSVFDDGEKSKGLVQMEGGEFAGTKEDKGPIFIGEEQKIFLMTHMSELLPKSGAPSINVNIEETKEWKPNIMNILDFAGTAFKFDDTHYDKLPLEDKVHIENLDLMKKNQWIYPLIKEEDIPSPSKMKTDVGPSRVWSLPRTNRKSNIKSSPSDSAPNTSKPETSGGENAADAATDAAGQNKSETDTPNSETKQNEAVTGNIEAKTPASKESSAKSSAINSSSAPNPKGGEKRRRDDENEEASKKMRAGVNLFINDEAAETGKNEADENENNDDQNTNDEQEDEILDGKDEEQDDEIVDGQDEEGPIHFEYTDNELRTHHERYVKTIEQLVATTTLLNALRQTGELCATKHDISRCIKSVSDCLEVKEKIEDQDIIDCNYTKLSKTASSNDKIRDKYMCITISAKEDVNCDDIIKFLTTDLKELNWRTTATNVEEIKVIEENVPLKNHILPGKPIKVMCAPFAAEAYHLVMEEKNNEEVEDDSELVVGNTTGARKPPKKRIIDSDNESGGEDDEGEGDHKQEGNIEVDDDEMEIGEDDKEKDEKGTGDKEEDEEGVGDKDGDNNMDVEENDNSDVVDGESC